MWLRAPCVTTTPTYLHLLFLLRHTQVFSIVPLTQNDWALVMAFSFPVILIDEGLKMIGR